MANISYGVNILPKTNNAYTLGNSDYKWANIFTNKINGTDVASIIAGGGSGGEGSSVDVSDKVDKAALLDAGITDSTYSTAFGGAFTVTTVTDSNHTIPYAKAIPTGVIDKHKRFRVTINDTEYILESRIWFLGNKFYNYLGDISKVYEHPEYVPGGTDSDVPFLITFDRDNNSAIEVYTTTAGTYTIKIETITDTFKKLPLELIYGSACAPILQSDNTGSTFNGYSIGVNILQNKRGTIAIGHGNDLRQNFSIAIGGNNIVSSGYTMVMGDNNTIQSNYGYVFGMDNTIYNSGNPVSILGFQNTIQTECATSIAIGYKNTIYANSHRAYAVGYWNLNQGDYSNTFGYSNCAFSDYTTAIGLATLANSKYQITLGTYNVIDTTTAWVGGTSYAVGDKVYINERWYECKTANSDANFTEDHWTRCRGHFVEILGNGNLDTSPKVRSNARATDWDGNTYIKGNLYIGCNADSSGGTRVPHDIQINGTSIVSNGVANISEATYTDYGVIKVSTGGFGITKNANGVLAIDLPGSARIKAGVEEYRPITPLKQHESVFYGLAKAAGDSTQSASSNSVGTYTANAQAAIQSMLAVAPTASPIFTGSISLGRAASTTVGTNSFAVGDNCEASAEEAHAEGRYTTASGYYSHAEGNYTFATGMAAHAEGTVTIANHASQHTFGEYNVEDSSSANAWERGNYIEIVGNGTASNSTSNARALDWDGNERLMGDLYVGCNADSSGGTKVATETYVTTQTSGKADKADTVLDTTLSRGRKANTTVGDGSFAFGDNVTSSSYYSHAEGAATTASGECSHAEGVGSHATGYASHGEGNNGYATGADSHAEGYNTAASGNYSHAEGAGGTFTRNNTSYTSGAKGDGDHTEGYQCLTDSNNQGGKHAEGYQTQATGGSAHSEGNCTTASGFSAHAEGSETTASGSISHAEGYSSTASNDYAHAEGLSSTASGYCAHAEGSTITSAAYAHSEGYQTTASGNYSHAEGNGTTAASEAQHVSGKFNVTDDQTTYAEIIGNGTDANTKSNARTLDWSGNERLKGNLYVGCNADSSGGSQVATVSALPSAMTGATSSAAGTGGLVPAPSAGDEDKFLAGDGTYKSGGLPMVILSYGTSTWSDFINAYNNNVIVYCRASSNSNPATGSQTRMAFMAYVNNTTTPTNVEFQYYRSMNPSNKSINQLSDQVFVYKLDKTSGWSVTTREASIKSIVFDASTGLTGTYNYNTGVLTITTAT